MSVCWQVVIKQCNKFDAKIKGQVLDELVLMKLPPVWLEGGGGDAVGGGAGALFTEKLLS